MADPAKRGKADKFGAWYLSYQAGDVPTVNRWRIEYRDEKAAGVAPGEPVVVDSAEVDPGAVYEDAASAITAAKAYAAKRAAADKAAEAEAKASEPEGDAS